MDDVRVLLVDDDEGFMKAIAEHIEVWGVEWEVAASGEAAVAALDDNPPDIMVLDLNLPGIGGMEVLEKATSDLPQVQIIILTGHGSDAVEVEARRHGAFDYLRKPVQIDDLMESIQKAASARPHPTS